MKINITGIPANLAEPVKIAAEYLNIGICDCGLPVTIKEGDCLIVDKNDGGVVITYSKRVEIFRGLMLLADNADKTEFSISEKARFDFNGFMIDNSRNAVLKNDTAKDMINYMAVMGLDKLMLYTEDTYEIDNYPYFGYLRGKFTKKELRELNDYAKEMGVELIPCIQTLAHLPNLLRWNTFIPITDYGDILLAGDENTYKLIEEMIKSCRESFDSDKINIGMDEAQLIGLGKYMQQHGVRPRGDIMCEHLQKVVEICKKYGFKPMMWSDMFFYLAFGYYYAKEGEISQEIIDKVPPEITLIYWDYYIEDAELCDIVMKKHLKFNNEIIFAGGAWKWSGFAPAITLSFDSNGKGLNNAIKNGLTKVFPTAWGDNGAEGSVYFTLPTLLQYAEMSYQSEYDQSLLEHRFKTITGADLDAFIDLELPNRTPTNKNVPWNNPCKYLLFQDILAGLFDKHVNSDFPAHYKYVKEKLAEYKDLPKFGYLFDNLSKLCAVLEKKCDVGIRIKNAYDNRDKAALREISDKELPEILDLVNEFHSAFRYQWHMEYRPGGFDVQDQRLGGLKARIETAKIRIDEYLDGSADSIPEMEEERLWFDCRTEELEEINTNCNLWHRIVTPNTMSHV